MIRNATIKDTKAITNIYNYYVLNDIATFAEELIPIKETEENIKKEIIGGYLICKTDTIDDALKLAEGCPVLKDGGHVEVRDVMVFD